jgi:cell division protease FtsH
MNKTVKAVVFWLLIGVSSLLLWEVIKAEHANKGSTEITYSQFMSDVEAGKVASVSITGTQIRGRYRDGSGMFHLTGPSDPKVFLGTLQEKGVEVSFRDAVNASGPMQLLGTWAPLILLGALWFFMIRKMQRQGPGPPAPPSSNAPINPV